MARTQIKDTHPHLIGEVAPGQDLSTIGGYAPSSGRLVKWQCSLGHTWDAKVVYRTQGSGCPVCANRVVLVGFNDLATTHPELAAEWHPVKNEQAATEVVAGSGKKVWWKCSEGHEWLTTILSRSQGAGCKECHKAGQVKAKKSGTKAKRGSVSLAVSHPGVAAQWSGAVEDREATAQTVSAGSGKGVIWKAVACGHVWDQSVTRRVASYSRGVVCAVCDGRTVLPGVNDLFTKHPHLLPEWDAVANGKPAPMNIAASSNDAYWWKCGKGHDWDAQAVKRALGQGCPVCSGRRLVVGQNDLGTVEPEIAAEWHPTKNGSLTPQQVTAKSDAPVWWECSKGHEWQTVVYSRSNGSNCAVCGGKQVKPGFNDLSTLMPAIAAEWHSTLNPDISPSQVTIKSGVKAWWKCPTKGHEWEAQVITRSNGHGCPKCVGRVSRGEQELIDFIESLNLGPVQTSVKGLLAGKDEIDVFIVDRNFAIEYNGIYYHSTRGAHSDPKGRHAAKYAAAQKAGIRLVQIWEDEWTFKKELVKRSLLWKLGISDGEKVGARETTLATIKESDAMVFLEQNHVQGFAKGLTFTGLQATSGEVVAVMASRKTAQGVEIVRYASSVNVQGGFTKLLLNLRKNNAEEPVFTFSDNCISDGRLYSSNGFVKDREVEPDYQYVVGRKRSHKSNYRLARFKSDPNLQYKEGLSESELAALNGLHRIWDAGKVRWLLK